MTVNLESCSLHASLFPTGGLIQQKSRFMEPFWDLFSRTIQQSGTLPFQNPGDLGFGTIFGSCLTKPQYSFNMTFELCEMEQGEGENINSLIISMYYLSQIRPVQGNF
jgi:hypothetical protein